MIPAHEQPCACDTCIQVRFAELQRLCQSEDRETPAAKRRNEPTVSFSMMVDGSVEDVELPAKFVVCHRCEGKGTHDPPPLPTASPQKNGTGLTGARTSRKDTSPAATTSRAKCATASASCPSSIARAAR